MGAFYCGVEDAKKKAHLAMGLNEISNLEFSLLLR